MSSIIFFLFFIPVLSIILLSVNFIFAPHKPYKEKKTPFECGYHSFSQTRSQFSISFFLFSYVFLLLDIEIILLYPFPLSATDNTIYGLFGMIIFTTIVTVGFVFELGKEALKITSKQYEEFPPDPYGFSSTQKLSMLGDPFIWGELTEANNLQALEELNVYFAWAVDMFNEAVVEYDFVMKARPESLTNPDPSALFTYSQIRGVISSFVPTVDSPMWGDKVFSGPNGQYFWLSHYKNNNMGIPYLKLEYPLLKSVYINPITGLSPDHAPVHALTRNWNNANDKIRFLNRGVHAVSTYFEIARSTVQNINAHLKYGYHLIEQWKAMETEQFLDMMGVEDDITDIYAQPRRVSLFSIMEKQGWEPESERARQVIAEIGDDVSPRRLRNLWIDFNTKLIQEQQEATRLKCEAINNSSVLSELARFKMDKYNHKFSNWPENPPVESLVEFTNPSPLYRSTIFNSVILPQNR